MPASVLRPPRLIGRDRELAALSTAWRSGQVAALIGEAGLGKTRLLQAFIESHPGVARAAGRPGDAGVPFATLARLLRAVMARSATPVDALLPASTRSEIVRVQPELEAAGSARTGEGQRLFMQRAVRALLQTQPGLAGLVVDDLHFADEASLEMLGSLIDGDDGDDGDILEGGHRPCAAGSSTVTTTVRPTALRWALAYLTADAGSPVQALHDGLVDEARLAPVALQPLDEAALAELVDSLGLPGLPDGGGKALAAGLRRRTGGNPLFVLETLKQAWIERTLAQLADAQHLPRPLSVSRLIERRVAQLSPGALALARAASIAGVDFSIAMAEKVLGATAMQFADALNELEAAQVLRDTQFAHDLVFDAVRGSVPAAIARHTHIAVATWLEAHGGEPARIARHWIDGAQAVRAVVWLEKAAQTAGAATRRKEQFFFLQERGDIEAAAGESAAAFESLMRACELVVTIDTQGALGPALCDQMEALAQAPERRVRVLTQRAVLAITRGDAAVAAAAASAGLQIALCHGVAAPVVFECRSQLATALGVLDRLQESIAQFEAMLVWIDEHGDDECKCEFHGNLAMTYDQAGRLGASVPHHERAIELARRLNDHGNLTQRLRVFPIPSANPDRRPQI